MMGGSSKWWGSEYASHVYERINGEWIESCEMKIGGIVYYIDSEFMPIPTDAIEIDSNKSLEMSDQCLRIKSPNSNYPADLNAVINITFPEQTCWNVTMRFQFTFDLPLSINCSETFIDISYSGENGEQKVGRFCGNELPFNEEMDHFPVESGDQLNIHFKSDRSHQQGFMLKVCKEDCCYDMNGVPNFWQEWSQWTYQEDQTYKIRERLCYDCLECPNEEDHLDFEIDTDTMVDSGQFLNKCFMIVHFCHNLFFVILGVKLQF